MSLGHRAFLAATWEFGSVSAQAVLQVAVIAVLARHLAPADFGLLAMANMAIGLVAMFAELGVGPALVQRSVLTDLDVNAAFAISLLLGVLGVFCLWFIAPLIATFFQAPDATNIVRALSLSLVIGSYTTVAGAMLARELNLKRLALANVGSYLLAFGIVGISLAIYGAGVWAIVVATLLQGVLRPLIIGDVGVRFSVRSLRGYAVKGLVRFGAGASLATLLNYVALQIDNLIVGKALGATTLGFYQIAFQIMDMPRRFLGSVIDKVMFSAMSRMHGDIDRLRAGYLKSVELGNTMMLPPTVLGVILAPELVRVFLGTRWLEIVIPLQILLIQVPLRGSIRMTDQLGGVLARNYSIAGRKFVYAVMIGIGTFAGSRWGLLGVAGAVTAVVVLNYLMMVQMALTMSEARWIDYLRSLVPGVRLAAIVFGVALPMATLMRTATDSHLMNVIVTVATTLLVTCGAVALRPALLGASGAWLIEKLSSLIGKVRVDPKRP